MQVCKYSGQELGSDAGEWYNDRLVLENGVLIACQQRHVDSLTACVCLISQHR
jgi:hypothetical protein